MFTNLTYLFMILSFNVVVDHCSPTAPILNNNLPIIKVNTVWSHDTYVTLHWNQIPQKELDEIDKEHPILGFKAKLWTEAKIKLFHFENKTAVETYDYIRPQGYDEIPETVPLIVTVDRNATSANLTVDLYVPYEYRVQAFSDLGDGPYSTRYNSNFQIGI